MTTNQDEIMEIIYIYIYNENVAEIGNFDIILKVPSIGTFIVQRQTADHTKDNITKRDSSKLIYIFCQLSEYHL
jgi:hypothetical protein